LLQVRARPLLLLLLLGLKPGLCWLHEHLQCSSTPQ
jgi:hypothetical protein